MQDSKGYTLVELLTVIVIMGILAANAVLFMVILWMSIKDIEQVEQSEGAFFVRLVGSFPMFIGLLSVVCMGIMKGISFLVRLRWSFSQIFQPCRMIECWRGAEYRRNLVA